jgi:hypothetical protein
MKFISRNENFKTTNANMYVYQRCEHLSCSVKEEPLVLVLKEYFEVHA